MLSFSLASTLSYAETKKPEAAMKSVIVYYSYTGRTETVAKTLASEIGADVVKIEDVEKPSKLKAYFLGAFAAHKGKAWPVKSLPSVSGYDRVFVGAPVWWMRPAPEINGFIQGTDFTGKTVVPFVTMGGSGQDAALKAMSAAVEAKGGKVSSTFSVKTGGLTQTGIVAKTKETAKQYR